MKQKQYSLLKGKELEQMVWKGADFQHIVWKDDESDSETSDTHSGSSTIFDSDEDVPCAKSWSHSESEGCSQEPADFASDKSSHPSAQGNLQQSPETVEGDNILQLVSTKGIATSTVTDVVPFVDCTDQCGQYCGHLLSLGSVGYHEFRTRLALGHYPPRRADYPHSKALWTQSAQSMESLSTVAPCPFDSLPSMAAMSLEDPPIVKVESMDSSIAATLDEVHPDAKRRGKLRPCKGKRDRYRKLVLRLVDEIREDPKAFNFESTDLPPSLASDDKAKEKLRGMLQKCVDEACAHHPEGASYQDECAKANPFHGSLSIVAPAPTEKTETYLKPKHKFRPCKGTRERHKKFALRLKEAIADNPDGFDFDAVELPPSIASHYKAKEKLKDALREHGIKVERPAALWPLGWQ